MKNVLLFLTISILVLILSCKKEKEPGRFELLTAHPWTSDSLLVDGLDASGPGQLLEKLAGDMEFAKDGTGYFGQHVGTWRFAYDERKLVIESPSLQMPISANIEELTTSSLKVTTSFPNPAKPLDIRMTFKAK